MKELGRLLSYSRPYTLPLFLSVILMAVAGFCHAMMALLIRPIFDRVLDPRAAEAPVQLTTIPILNKPLYLHQIIPFPLHDVWQLVAAGILLVFLIRGAADYCGNYLVNYAGFSAVTDLRQRVFERVVGQDAVFFESHTTGRLMSSIMNDVDKIQQATSSMLADWLRQTFSALGLLWVVLQMDWKLAIVSFTVLPFVFVPTARLGRKLRRTTRGAQDDAAELNQILQETLTGHQVVKSFGAEGLEAERFRKASARLRSSNLRYAAQQAIASPLIEFFGALTIVILLTYARGQIQLGRLTTGEFTSFVIALLMLYEPVKRLTGIHNIFQQGLGASQKVFEYLDRDQFVKEKRGAVALDGFHEEIQLERLAFRYPTTPDGFLLRDVNLTVKAGEVVALVGPSGAGKSTLANLLARFYDVSSGAIRVDGHDIRDVTLASLRRQIGIVAQDTFLFNDTVANNIRYGRPEAGDEEVRRAARGALAEDFIERLPRGYDTLIGERGMKLSGGQRQRIAIARALLKDAPVLILDEATSHLDTESEMLVQRALSNLINGRTVIVIAHRLSTIRRAGKIVVLDHGRIVETGAHEELVNAGGVYQRLHELQFLEADPLVNS
ncbi:MAG: ATP-binding cassette domain-containing protein [Bryobacterales bacterium]|nr:ATP-binding cassette domain-containing protein [Bryobacterales bacterium]